jgi:hypothetical protein
MPRSTAAINCSSPSIRIWIWSQQRGSGGPAHRPRLPAELALLLAMGLLRSTVRRLADGHLQGEPRRLAPRGDLRPFWDNPWFNIEWFRQCTRDAIAASSQCLACSLISKMVGSMFPRTSGYVSRRTAQIPTRQIIRTTNGVMTAPHSVAPAAIMAPSLHSPKREADHDRRRVTLSLTQPTTDLGAFS